MCLQMSMISCKSCNVHKFVNSSSLSDYLAELALRIRVMMTLLATHRDVSSAELSVVESAAVEVIATTSRVFAHDPQFRRHLTKLLETLPDHPIEALVTEPQLSQALRHA